MGIKAFAIIGAGLVLAALVVGMVIIARRVTDSATRQKPAPRKRTRNRRRS